MKKHLIILVVSVLLTACFIRANDGETALKKIDGFFSAMTGQGKPGAAIAIVKDGKVLLTKGYGMANLEYDAAITPQTVFDIASLSKQFTGLAIAMLETQGKISIDDDIRKYIPEVPDFGKTITLRHLIHHTSGLRDWPEALAMAGYRFEDLISFEHIMKWVSRMKKLNFEPGTEYLYSNTNYNLLAEVVKRVTGQTFREWMTAHIFKPLEMTGTHVHDSSNEIVKNRAYSYELNKSGKYVKSAENLTAYGSSSLYTTIEDMAKWMINLESGTVGGKAALETFFSTGTLNNGKAINYAYGIGVSQYKGLKTFSHSGSWAGFTTYLLYFPDHSFAVTVFLNYPKSAGKLAHKIAALYMDKYARESEYKPKTASSAAKIDFKPGALDKFTGKYRLYPGFSIEITREGNALMAQATRQQKLPIYPESENTFFYTHVNAYIVFHKDKNGNVNRITFSQNNNERACERIETTTLPIESLKQYEGVFYCSELDARYSMLVKNGTLTLIHSRHDDLSLEPLRQDVFASNIWAFRIITFNRGNNNRITGFTVDGGRVRDYFFSKRKDTL